MIEKIRVFLWNADIMSTLLRLLLAAVFGGVIGMERGRRRRAAGLRTHMLVCMGAALVMLTSQYIINQTGHGDITRMGAQVVSGIGFLGAGTIIVDRHQQVRGLTTAAGLWACACMGLALGMGFYTGAIIAFIFILAIMATFNRLEQILFNYSKTVEIYVEFTKGTNRRQMNRLVDILDQNSIKVLHTEIVPSWDYNLPEPYLAAIFTLKLPEKKALSVTLKKISQMPDIQAVEELHF